MQNKIKSILDENIKIKKEIKENLVEKVIEAAKIIINCYKNKGKVIIFGNGGSAADAQHFASEMVNKFKIKRKPLPAIALTTDASIITSIANDVGYEYVFEKQINALCNENDIIIAITTSDVSLEKNKHSSNIAKGIIAAKNKKAKVIGLISERGEEISKIVDLALTVPSSNTPRIQEAHITILHIICELVENEFK